MKIQDIAYYPMGRYTDDEIEGFLPKGAGHDHRDLVLLGCTCQPDEDSDEGLGVRYHLAIGYDGGPTVTPSMPVESQCCTLTVTARKDHGWRAETCCGAGAIYGDSKINGEFADTPRAAIEHLLDRLEEESERGPEQERAQIAAVEEMIEDAVAEYLGEYEEHEEGEEIAEGEHEEPGA